MGRSFFTGTDADLYTGSAAFSTQISATPTAFGLVAAQATAYAAVNAAYATAYLAATNPDTRTKGKVADLRQARANLKAAASDLAKIIDGTPTVTDGQRANLGLNVRARPSPIPAPVARPVMEIVSVAERTVTIRVRGTSTRSGRPAGTKGAWVYSFVGTNYPSDPTGWSFEGATSKRNLQIVFPSTLAAGTQVWICAAWINGKQEAGPTCVPLSTNLQGGGAAVVNGMKLAA
jgi:hypothetical protein